MKLVMRGMAIVAALLLASVAGVAAQDTACTLDDLEITLTALEALVAEAQDAEDVAEAIPIVGEIGAIASESLARCGPLAWEGETAQLLGPADIDAGFYRATVLTEGYFSAQVVSVSGECGQGPRMSQFLFNLSGGEASDGAEALFVSEGCTALIETGNISEPWNLTLEKIN